MNEKFGQCCDVDISYTYEVYSEMKEFIKVCVPYIEVI